MFMPNCFKMPVDCASFPNQPRISISLRPSSNAIVQDDIRPTPLPTRRKRHSWNSSVGPSWIPMVLAASVVLVVSLGSYFYFAMSDRFVAQRTEQLNPQPKTEVPAQHATQT